MSGSVTLPCSGVSNVRSESGGSMRTLGVGAVVVAAAVGCSSGAPALPVQVGVLCGMADREVAAAEQARDLSDDIRSSLKSLSGRPTSNAAIRVMWVAQILDSEAHAQAQGLGEHPATIEFRKEGVMRAYGADIAEAVGSVAKAQAKLREVCRKAGA